MERKLMGQGCPGMFVWKGERVPESREQKLQPPSPSPTSALSLHYLGFGGLASGIGGRVSG